ncbi:MAG: hypothetical protein ABIL68_16555 [bacterium]
MERVYPFSILFFFFIIICPPDISYTQTGFWQQTNGPSLLERLVEVNSSWNRLVSTPGW